MAKSKARPISERGQRWMIGFPPPPNAACGASRLQGPSRRHAPGNSVRPCGVSCFGAPQARDGVCVCTRTCGGCSLLLVATYSRPNTPRRACRRAFPYVLSPSAVGINIRYAKHECSPTTFWALDGRRFGGLTASNRLVRVLLADGTPGAQLVKGSQPPGRRATNTFYAYSASLCAVLTAGLPRCWFTYVIARRRHASASVFLLLVPLVLVPLMLLVIVQAYHTSSGRVLG